MCHPFGPKHGGAGKPVPRGQFLRRRIRRGGPMFKRKDREGPRRQWGGDRRTDPLSALPPKASEARITFARLAIVVTLVGWLAYVADWTVVTWISPADVSTRSRVE